MLLDVILKRIDTAIRNYKRKFILSMTFTAIDSLSFKYMQDILLLEISIPLYTTFKG